MESRTYEQIKLIHKSDCKVILAEVGCGLPISNALMSIPGASNTVLKALCMYDKDEQFKEYASKHRAVSREFIEDMITRYRLLGIDPNTIVCSSFQVGENMVNHGWIGICHKDDVKYYHITLHNTGKRYHREQAMEDIAKAGVALLFTALGCFISSKIFHLDTALNNDGTVNIHTLTRLGLKGKEISVLDFDYNPYRLEDILRKYKNVAFYKGSFNPLHDAHANIIKHYNTSKDNAVLLCISLKSVGKKQLVPSEIEALVYAITKTKYGDNVYILLTAEPMYYPFIQEIKARNRGTKIIMPMGYDTLQRLDMASIMEEGITYDVFERGTSKIDGPISHLVNFISTPKELQALSSTKIREANGKD